MPYQILPECDYNVIEFQSGDTLQSHIQGSNDVLRHVCTGLVECPDNGCNLDCTCLINNQQSTQACLASTPWVEQSETWCSNPLTLQLTSADDSDAMRNTIPNIYYYQAVVLKYALDKM